MMNKISRIFLRILCNGEYSEEDCVWIRGTFNFENKLENEIHTFTNNDAIAIHNSKANIWQHNIKKLKDLNKQIYISERNVVTIML